MKNNTITWFSWSSCLAVAVSISAGCSFVQPSVPSPEAKAKLITFEKMMKASCTVVYVTKDIFDGKKITAKALEERHILYADAPIDAVTSAKRIVGRTAIYGISQGSIVSEHDMYPVNEKTSKESESTQIHACEVIAEAIHILDQKSASKTDLSEFEQHLLADKCTVVYAVQSVVKGREFPKESLQLRQLTRGKAPGDAVSYIALFDGRIAKYGISAGQVVSQHDIATLSPSTIWLYNHKR